MAETLKQKVENKEITPGQAATARVIAGTACAALILALPVLAGKGCYNSLGEEREAEMHCYKPRAENRDKDTFRYGWSEWTWRGRKDNLPEYQEGRDPTTYPLRKFTYKYIEPVRITGGVLAGFGALALELVLLAGLLPDSRKKDSPKKEDDNDKSSGNSSGSSGDSSNDDFEMNTRDHGSIYGQTRI